MEGREGRGRGDWRSVGCPVRARATGVAPRVLGDGDEVPRQTLDIHCGGVDLVFPHHEDEIAQSEGATGQPFSRFWCHGEFLLVDGTKMAKRIGNVSTVKDLREHGVSAAAMRHFIFSTHYRKQINLSAAGLEASMEAVTRIGEFSHRLGTAHGGTSSLGEAADEAVAPFRAALLDDLNGPEAMAASSRSCSGPMPNSTIGVTTPGHWPRPGKRSL